MSVNGSKLAGSRFSGSPGPASAAREGRVQDLSAAASDGPLHDAALRAARQPAGRVAVVLHLSRLPALGVRPHHRRVARALMQDTAGRYDGQVFERPSGDLVLLCRRGLAQAPSPGQTGRSTTADPLALPEILTRLLRAGSADPGQLVSVWSLEDEQELLLAYTATRTRPNPAPPAREDYAGQTSLIDVLGGVVDQVNLGDVLRRQTAIVLGEAPDTGLTPLYRDLSFAVPSLEARLAEAGQIRVDPFLFRHLSARLDQRVLAAVTASLGRGGALDASTGESHRVPMLHLSLTVAGVLSPAFAALAEACRRLPGPVAVGVELAVMEVAADTQRFARARARLAEAGFRFVLGGVSHLSLQIADPAPLRPDLMKLDWSQRLPDLPDGEAEAVDTALRAIGPQRIVLHRADSEAALHWGLARGIRRFQGRHVDMMLGAARIVSCVAATQCTLRQCVERARTVAASGRAGCANHALLDHGAPFTAVPADRDAAGRARPARSTPVSA
jgi:hypothetical protein